MYCSHKWEKNRVHTAVHLVGTCGGLVCWAIYTKYFHTVMRSQLDLTTARISPYFSTTRPVHFLTVLSTGPESSNLQHQGLICLCTFPLCFSSPSDPQFLTLIQNHVLKFNHLLEKGQVSQSVKVMRFGGKNGTRSGISQGILCSNLSNTTESQLCKFSTNPFLFHMIMQ